MALTPNRFEGLIRRRATGAPVFSNFTPPETGYHVAPMAPPSTPPKQSLDVNGLLKLGGSLFEDKPAGEAFQGTNPAYAIQGNNAVTSTGSRLGLLSDQGAPDLDRLVNAVAKLESGNNYSSVGRQTKSGDRAYGFSQVMGANIPSWTKAAMGYSMTPQEYLASPDAQRAVTRHFLGNYLKQYGNINDAASMWFSGRPAAGNHSRDVNNTSVPDYIRTINRNY